MKEVWTNSLVIFQESVLMDFHLTFSVLLKHVQKAVHYCKLQKEQLGNLQETSMKLVQWMSIVFWNVWDITAPMIEIAWELPVSVRLKFHLKKNLYSSGPPLCGSNPLNSISATTSTSKKGTFPYYRGTEGSQQKVTEQLVHGPNHNTYCNNFLGT